jgi:hypothetical protein
MDYNVSIYVEVSDTLISKKMTYYSVNKLAIPSYPVNKYIMTLVLL